MEGECVQVHGVTIRTKYLFISPPTQLAHTRIQTQMHIYTQPRHPTYIPLVHADLIIRSSPPQYLVSRKGDMADNGTERTETKAPLSPFSPSCLWLSRGIVRLSARHQSTHLEREANPILSASTKPLAPLFLPLVSSIFFCLLSVGIFQTPGVLFIG